MTKLHSMRGGCELERNNSITLLSVSGERERERALLSDGIPATELFFRRPPLTPKKNHPPAFSFARMQCGIDIRCLLFLAPIIKFLSLLHLYIAGLAWELINYGHWFALPMRIHSPRHYVRNVVFWQNLSPTHDVCLPTRQNICQRPHLALRNALESLEI